MSSIEIIDANLLFGSLSHRSSTNRIILHHAEASVATPELIQDWHVNGNGWAGAGYHFLVRKDGTIYSMRPEWAVGSHAKGSNYDSIGICFEGNFMTEEMPQAQLDAGRELVAYLKAKYGIDTVLRHKDVYDTNCPGDNFPFREIVGVYPNTERRHDVIPILTGDITFYRLYNANEGRHHFPASETERNNLIAAGWNEEEGGWRIAPGGTVPIYRLYNPNDGDHVYMRYDEAKMLEEAGWVVELAFMTHESGEAVHRLYNPNAGEHFYTTDAAERDHLVSVGWNDEGIGWYAA